MQGIENSGTHKCARAGHTVSPRARGHAPDDVLVFLCRAAVYAMIVYVTSNRLVYAVFIEVTLACLRCSASPRVFDWFLDTRHPLLVDYEGALQPLKV